MPKDSAKDTNPTAAQSFASKVAPPLSTRDTLPPPQQAAANNGLAAAGQGRVPPAGVANLSHFGAQAGLGQYGQQGRRAAPVQNAAAGPGYYSAPGGFPQQVASNLSNQQAYYNYVVPPYHQTQFYRGPTPPVAQAAPPMPSRDFAQAPVVRVPTRTRKPVAIIDPSTQEEIHIEKQEQPKAATPQVSPPVRKPLQVVSPANAADTTEVNKPPASSEVDMKTAVNEPSEVAAAKVVVAAVSEDPTSSSTSGTKESTTIPPVSIDEKPVAPATNSSDKEMELTVLSENKQDSSEKGLSSLPSTESMSVASASDSKLEDAVKPKDVVTNGGDKTALALDKETSSLGTPSEAEDSQPAVVKEPVKEPNSDPSVSESALSKVSSTTELPTENSYPSPPKRERPTAPKWVEGERRCYPIPFLRSMKAFTIPGGAEQFEKKLCEFNISQGQNGSRSDAGGSRRGGRGYASDPRGRGVLEPSGGYMGPRGPGVLGGTGVEMFDLGGARNRAPPPVDSKGNRSNYDPRGSRTQDGGRGGRSSGPMRGGVGPMDLPTEKLAKSENHWSRNKEADTELEKKTKLMKSLLNKLTLEKFEKISDKICEIELTSSNEVRAVVAEIFEKVLFEPKFAILYASLCSVLEKKTKAAFDSGKFVSEDGKGMTFRKVLLRLCQNEFQKVAPAAANANAGAASSSAPANPGASSSENATNASEDASAAAKNEGEKEVSEEDKKKAEREKKQRMLANILFIAELFNQGLIGENIIHKQCVGSLLSQAIRTKETDVLEGLIKLVPRVGKKLESNPTGYQAVTMYLERINALSQDMSLPKRIRCLLQDVVELRSRDWKPRIEESKMKKLREVQQEVAREYQKKQAHQNELRSQRSGGGGGRRDRRPGYGNPPPSMQMTMGSQRSTSNASRAQTQLEQISRRGGNRSALPGNMSNMRLGPQGRQGGGGGANGWNSVTRTGSRGASSNNGTQLRPANRMGGFAALAAVNGDQGSTNESRTSSKPSAPPAPKGPALMTDDDCKRAARGIMMEYWSIHDDKELRECVEERIGTTNGLKFVEFSVRHALTEKIAKRNEGIPYFKQLLIDTCISRDSITSAFKNVIESLDDISMDDPRAGEFIARYVAGMFSTGKMSTDDGLGLDFIKAALKNSMGKTPIKFVVQFLFEYNEFLEKDEVSAEDRKSKVTEAFRAINVDLVRKAVEANPMRGVSSLQDMLKEKKMEYLLPNIQLDGKLVASIDGGKSGQELYDEVTKLDGVDQNYLTGVEFANSVVLNALTIYFCGFNPTDKIAEKLSDGAGKLIKLCHGDNAPPADVQYEVLIAVQNFIHLLLGKATVPELAAEYEGKKHGHVIFDALYDADVVEEDAFMKWKSDDSAKVMKAGGKPEVLLQTASWFKWLETAEEAS